MHIVRAKPEDAANLTGIAFAAKRHWGYPENWIESWRDLLTCPHPQRLRMYRRKYFDLPKNSLLSSRLYLLV
jgi:hypothetical protein